MGLRLGRSVADDSVLSVRSLEAPHHVPWVRVRVLQCFASGRHEWLVGCELEESVPWPVMVWFGTRPTVG
jgi:hypothetical protein